MRLKTNKRIERGRLTNLGIKKNERLNKIRGRPRRANHYLPLNLPENIWQQYQQQQQQQQQYIKSFIENIKDTHTETNLPTKIKNENTNKCLIKDTMLNGVKSETNLPIKTETENVNKCLTKDNDVKSVDTVNSAQNQSSILKQLSVKIDNSYAVQFNCNHINEKIKEVLEIHKNFDEKIMNAKQLIYNKGKELSDIIFEESELENALNLLKKLKLLLLDLQKNLHEILVPLSISTYYNIEQDNMLKLSGSISEKQQEIDILKQKNETLKNQLCSCEQKLLKTKQARNNIVKTKDQFLLESKKKLLLAKKRIRILSENITKKNIVHNNTKSSNIHAQLENIVALAKSVQENILESQPQICSYSNQITETDNKDEIINLKQQLRNQQMQNKQKDKKIQTLLISERRLNKQIINIEEKSKLQDKQNKFEIAKLTSSIDNLKRQHDRWLIDKYHQNCHSIMLFEKMKQIEIQQNKNSLFRLKNVENNSDGTELSKT